MNATVNEIEREIEAGRARLDGVLNQLQDRLHPVAFVEDVLGTARRSGTGGDIYNLSLDALRRYPVPALLICVGVSMLLARVKRPAKISAGNLQSASVQKEERLRRGKRARIYTGSI